MVDDLLEVLLEVLSRAIPGGACGNQLADLKSEPGHGFGRTAMGSLLRKLGE